MIRFATAAAFALAASAAWGGEPFTAMNGYAASGYDVVAFFDQPTDGSAHSPDAAVPGRASITAEHAGGTYAFSSAANRAAFLESPARYAPLYDGHCAFGISRGVKTAGAPVHWMIQDGALLFHGSETVHGLWQDDAETNLLLADGNWDTLSTEPAATDAAQGFDAATAPRAD